MMPGLDGVETLKLLRDEKLLPEETKVIALSANAISGARESYLAAGFDGYLSKPIDIAALEQTMLRYLPEECIMKKTEDSSGDNGSESSLPEWFSALPEDIDTARGLNSCMNDAEFYRSLLEDFAGSAAGTAEKLGSFLEQNDLDNYRILVHSLKSSSKTVGAMRLSAAAEKLEAAAKNNDRQYINENHRGLCDALADIAGRLAEAFGRQ